MSTPDDPRLNPDYQAWLAGRRPAEPVPEPDPEPTAELEGDEDQDQPEAEPELPAPAPMCGVHLHPDDAIGAPAAAGHSARGQAGLGAGVSN